VNGPFSLTLALRDSQNASSGSAYEVKEGLSTDPITYLEGSYLWGEVAIASGNTVFRINRNAPDPNNPTQHLPPYLRLKIEYSGALKAAVQEPQKAGFNPQTGEFWVGRFRCGSAIPAATSSYRISVQLLEDGQEIVTRRYVIGVLNNPTCAQGDKGGSSGGPPSQR
jgi:hypothetical protein